MATPSFFLFLGMVVIPVKSYPAARDERVELTNLHAPCAQAGRDARLTVRRVCTACSEEVGEAIVKGYPVGKGRYVLVAADEIEALAAEKSKGMEIRAFVPWKEVDPVYLGPANYLGPADPAAAKPFQLLRLAMQLSDRAALVQYVGSGRDKIGLIRVVPEALMLHELYYPAEVRSFAAQNRVEIGPIKVSDEELELALKLVDSLEGPFDLSGYRNEYMGRLTDLIQARLAGQEPPKLAAPAPAAPVVDLVAALKRSLSARVEPAPAKATSARKAKAQSAPTARTPKRRAA
jgi:DNA end-binding protein Ku